MITCSMMISSRCTQRAIIEHPHLCKEHFIDSFEQRVLNTIETHRLLKKTDRVAVAVSGGKDSLTVLTLLHKFGYAVTAILIDEGIPNYREHTIDDMKRVCGERDIPFRMFSFKEHAGMTLQEMIHEKIIAHPCTGCGAIRRHLLAKASKEFDVIATGHNADDESQAVLMNIIKGNTELFARQGPMSGIERRGFTPRVKPLYFCTEKEIMTYAYLHGLVHDFHECPHVAHSYRRAVRDEFNRYAQLYPGARRDLLQRFLEFKKTVTDGIEQPDIILCSHCNEPASGALCKSCSILASIGKGV